MPTRVVKKPLLYIELEPLHAALLGPTFPGGMWSQSDKAYNRLLQICMPDLSPFNVKIVDSVDDTTRGSGGLGSTGK